MNESKWIVITENDNRCMKMPSKLQSAEEQG